MNSNIRKKISDLSKSKRILATVISVSGNLVGVQLQGGGALNGIQYLGPSPVIGSSVLVDYSSGVPVCMTYSRSSAANGSPASQSSIPSGGEASDPDNPNRSEYLRVDATNSMTSSGLISMLNADMLDNHHVSDLVINPMASVGDMIYAGSASSDVLANLATLAYGASATSMEPSDWPDRVPGNIIDLNDATRWLSHNIDTPDWFEIDLGAVKIVHSIRMLQGGGIYGRPYDISASLNGVDYTTVVSYRDDGAETSYDLPADTMGRYWRFTMHYREHWGEFWSVYTVELIGYIPDPAYPPRPIALPIGALSQVLSVDVRGLPTWTTPSWEPAVTKGNLTASSPLSFDQTRQVIGGAAALSFDTATETLTKYLKLSGGTLTGQLTSTLATGTSPFAVTSTTVNANLNADLLDGNEASAFATSGHNHDATYLKLTGGTLTGQLTSTVATGTSPFAVTSTTVNANLNADMVDGHHAGSFLVNEMANVGDTIYLGAVTSVQNTTSPSGNYYVVAGNGGTAALAGCDLTLTGFTGSITVGLDIWLSQEWRATFNVCLRRDSAAGEILETWSFDEWGTGGSDGHKQHVSDTYVDAVPTTGRYVVTVVGTGGIYYGIYSDTRGMALSGPVDASVEVLPIGSDGQVLTVVSDVVTGYHIPAWATPGWEPALTKGNLTASSPLSFDQTRQVIGGAAALSFDTATTALTKYLLLTGGTLTGALTINGSVTGAVQLTVRGAAGQTGSLFELQSSGGAALVGVTAGGTLQLTPSSGYWDTDKTIYIYKDFTSISATKMNVGSYMTVAYPADSGQNSINLRFVSTVNVASGKTASGYAWGSAGGVAIGATHAGTLTTAIGMNSYASIANGAAGIVTNYDLYRGWLQWVSTNSTTITNFYGIHYLDSTTNRNGGTVTNAYGLYLDGVSGATTLNYAIYTNAGLNRLGDQLSVVGSADRIQAIIKGNSTQTTNIQEWQNSSSTILGYVAQPASSYATLSSTELVTNYSFDTDLSGWTYGGGTDWTWSAGSAVHTAGNLTAISQTINVVSGKTYVVNIQYTVPNSGLVLAVGSYIAANLFYPPYYGSFKASSSGAITISLTPYSDVFTGSIQSISIKELTTTTTANFGFNNPDGTAAFEVRSGKSYTGAYNLFLGKDAGKTNYSGSNNVFFGPFAGANNVVGNNNAFIGSSAGNLNTSGSNNTFIGLAAGQKNTEGGGNVCLGYYAGNSNTTGMYNFFMGFQSGFNNTTGTYNIMMGYNAGYSNQTSESIIAIGGNAGYNTTNHNNIFIGQWSGYANTSGRYNISLGEESLRYTVTGSSNIAIGYRALYGVSTNTHTDNTAVGTEAGRSITTGGYNTFIGRNAGYSVTTGASNTFLGRNAGYHASQKVDAANSLSVGEGTYTTASNQAIIGNASVTDVYMAMDGEATTRTVGIKTDTTTPTDLTITTGAGKTLVLATPVYKDIFFPQGVTKATGTGNPAYVTVIGNLKGYSYAVNDTHDFDPQEYPHDGVVGGTLHWHVHWLSMTNVAATRGVKWEIEYTYALANGALATTTTASVDLTVAANTAAATAFLSDVSDWSPTSIAPGSMIMVRIKRITSAGTAPANDPVVLGVHAHYSCDTLGSRTETAK